MCADVQECTQARDESKNCYSVVNMEQNVLKMTCALLKAIEILYYYSIDTRQYYNVISGNNI